MNRNIAAGVPLRNSVLMYIRGFFFWGEQYNSWPLWYLLSTVYALMLILLLLRRKLSYRGGCGLVWYFLLYLLG